MEVKLQKTLNTGRGIPIYFYEQGEAIAHSKYISEDRPDWSELTNIPPNLSILIQCKFSSHSYP